MEHRPTRLSLLKVISVHNCTFFSVYFVIDVRKEDRAV